MDIYGDSIYIHVSSKDSAAYFPENRADNFRIKLAKRLELKGVWKIAICEINVSDVILRRPVVVVKRADGDSEDDNDDQKTDVKMNVDANGVDDDTVCIHCNVCTGLIVNGEQTRILRTLPLKKNQYKIYPIHYYCPLETQNIDTIEFNICKSNGTPLSFDAESGHVSMTLRLKRSC